MVKENILLMGASSEIAIQAEKILKENFNLYKVSRYESDQINSLVIKDYVNDIESILEFIKSINNPKIIFFNGFLAENRDFQNPNLFEIKNTYELNFLIPYYLSLRISKESVNISKYIYISSIAACKPRYKNYIYGLEKRKLEESVKQLGLSSSLIIRYGKVLTKMSQGHKNPPFTLTSIEAAYFLSQNLNKSGLIYPKFGLRLLAILIKVLPNIVIKKIAL
jgi:hypothetical protein